MERTLRLGYSSGSGVISGIFYRLLLLQRHPLLPCWEQREPLQMSLPST